MQLQIMVFASLLPSIGLYYKTVPIAFRLNFGNLPKQYIHGFGNVQ